MTSPGTLETHLYDNNDRRPIEPVSRERRPVSSSDNPATMPSLISLPNEIVHNILTFVDPSDLGRVPRTCRALRRFVEGDGQIWKDVYCGNLDVPLSASGVRFDVDFKEGIIGFVSARNVIRSRLTVVEKVEELPLVAEVVTRLCRWASTSQSRNQEILEEWFREDRDNKDNLEAFLCQSTTFTRSKLPNDSCTPPSLDLRQLSAKLHVLNGQHVRSPRRAGYSSSYPFAASMVYDLRNYRTETFWGPYLPDGKGSVDWEKMEAVMIVLGHNMSMFPDGRHGLYRPHWNEPWWGTKRNSFVSETPRLDPPPSSPDLLGEGEEDGEEKPVPDFEDPYNITGTWMRIVTFLDFHELFSYNFIRGVPPIDQPREPIHTSEAIRMIVMVLKATKREECEDWNSMPIVHFEGTASALNNIDPSSDSLIKGTVRMTHEGEVRWESYSLYGSMDAEPRWKSDGIQVGGPNSGRGVLGHWFDKDFSQHGPAGPTAYWKVSDKLDDVEQFSGQISQPIWNMGFADDDDEDEGEDGDGDEGLGAEEEEGGVVGRLEEMYGPAFAAALLGAQITVVNDVGQMVFNGPGEMLQTFLDAAGVGVLTGIGPVGVEVDGDAEAEGEGEGEGEQQGESSAAGAGSNGGDGGGKEQE